MKLKNQIISYFVATVPGEKYPHVFKSLVFMDENVAAEQLNKQGVKISASQILRVCYDMDSGLIYVPNASNFSEKVKNYLLSAAEIKISKDFGGYRNISYVEGSPLSLIRIRKMSNYHNIFQLIQKQQNTTQITDLPVIEVNLERMPKTAQALAEALKIDSIARYVGTSVGNAINFVEELNIDGVKLAKPKVLHKQATPFILVNIANGPNSIDKESGILISYKTYLKEQEEKGEGRDEDSTLLYTIKMIFYLGWPLEEICNTMLRLSQVHNIASLFKGVDAIMTSIDTLKSEGHVVQALPYYITFKIDPKSFPIKLNYIMDSLGNIDVGRQNANLKVIDYDPKTSYVIIETPIYLSPDVCVAILKAKSEPFITTFNPLTKFIDVRSHEGSYTDIKQDRVQLAKIVALNKFTAKDEAKMTPEEIKKIELRSDESSRGSAGTYRIRKISDYLYAYDFISKMCEKNNAKFNDLTVVVGPISRFMGEGAGGGFVDAATWAKANLPSPYEVDRNIWISPPVILINSEITPGYPAQTKILIHEYRHYIYSQANPDYVKGYGDMNKEKRGTQEWKRAWWKYFNDFNEVAAHKEDIKYSLLSGESPDELIKEKLGAVGIDNYPIVLKFKELIDAVMEEIKKEEEINEKPTGTS